MKVSLHENFQIYGIRFLIAVQCFEYMCTQMEGGVEAPFQECMHVCVTKYGRGLYGVVHALLRPSHS